MSRFMYTSAYLNSTFVLRTTDGRLISLVAGKHEKNFPFYHEKSEWDNMLLHVGGPGASEQKLAVAHSAQDIGGLQVEVSDNTRARIVFDGELQGAGKTMHKLEFALDIALKDWQKFPFIKWVDQPWMWGMMWQPFYGKVQPEHSRFVIDGKPLRLQSGWGQIEKGELTNWKSDLFAFCYDYYCLVQPDSGDVVLYFQSRSVTERNWAEKGVSCVLRRFTERSLLINDQECKDLGEAHIKYKETEEGTLLAGDTVDLGLMWLDRHLITLRDNNNRELIGLREEFLSPAHQAKW